MTKEELLKLTELLSKYNECFTKGVNLFCDKPNELYTAEDNYYNQGTFEDAKLAAGIMDTMFEISQ